MDEGTLNDLLECSVCLERLDTSSKVLPCQHTFCRKCLEEIVEKHKELRCPECRVLVNIKINNLPPNVLLMRILEGIKNSAPSNNQYKSSKDVHVSQDSVQTQVVTNTAEQPHVTSNKTNTTPGTQLGNHFQYARALFDYEAQQSGDLSFKRGATITLKKRIDKNWYHGELDGRQGVFPISYVRIITPVPSIMPLCKALYDFQMNSDEDEGCLAFKKNDIINVIRRVDENWAEGKINGKIGIFPLAFVELNSLARSLMKLSTNSQPGPSKLAPPTPTDDVTPLISVNYQSQTVSAHPVATVASENKNTLNNSNSSSSTTTPSLSSSSNNSSSSSTAPSSPASPPQKNQAQNSFAAGHTHDLTHTRMTSSLVHHRDGQSLASKHLLSNPINQRKEKRHSFTGGLPSLSDNFDQLPAEPIRNKEAQQKFDVTLPASYVALYPYKPQKSDELELKKGGLYIVTDRCLDGWFKGTSNRTQKCGVFPGNYVVPTKSLSSSGSESKHSASRVHRSKDEDINISLNKSLNQAPPKLPPRLIASASSSERFNGGSSSAAASLNVQLAQLLQNSKEQSDKLKERKDRGSSSSSVSLMKRLASIKRSKSPPNYSMDNPVFEDSSEGCLLSQPSHVRSGSCPSQLVHIQTTDQHHRLPGSSSQRLKLKERPSILAGRSTDEETGVNSNNLRHRKSQSLDSSVSKSVKSQSASSRERYRCITAYPANSEYELSLQVGDIIYVHRKREDGWYKGTQQRTGKTGLFPASFVESF